MESAKFSRRIFIKTLLAAVITAGCRPTSPSGSVPTALPSQVPTPGGVTPTPTDLPQPDAVAQSYFSAWEATDFQQMYHLLTTESKQRMPENDFRALHAQVFSQTTTLDVIITAESTSIQSDTATVAFTVRWDTALFGAMDTAHMMQLRFVDGSWRVVWEPQLLLPQLGYGITLVLREAPVERGGIFAADDTVLAGKGQILAVGVVPGQLADPTATATQLAPILGVDVDYILTQINAAQPDWYVPLGTLDLDTAGQYGEFFTTSTGIEAQVTDGRAYPLGDTAAHIIGTLGVIPAEKAETFRKQGYRGDEFVGQTGLEAWGEPFLAGKRGGNLVTLAPGGSVRETLATAEAVPGGHIHLHLDVALQQYAETLLGARPGAIITQKITGEVVAMATYPRFQPQDFAAGVSASTWNTLLNDPLSPMLNRATQGTYPPGSVFKIISMATAMEKLDMSPETTFTCNGIWYGLGENFPKSCWLKSGHGVISLRDGLTQSCDVVFYEVGKALYEKDPTLLPEMARAFGLGQSTGILGADDAAGLVPDNAWKQQTYGEPFYVGDAVNMAIGQGFLLTTPLQVAQTITAIAANSSIYRPQLLRKLSSQTAGDQLFTPEIPLTAPITPFTLANIQQAMIGVAHGRRGTARAAFDGVGFTVAGKTGTAETGISSPHAWFAGYAPAEAPEIVVVVMLENAGEGSAEAAPLFRKMAEAYFYGI